MPLMHGSVNRQNVDAQSSPLGNSAFRIRKVPYKIIPRLLGWERTLPGTPAL